MNTQKDVKYAKENLNMAKLIIIIGNNFYQQLLLIFK